MSGVLCVLTCLVFIVMLISTSIKNGIEDWKACWEALKNHEAYYIGHDGKYYSARTDDELFRTKRMLSGKYRNVLESIRTGEVVYVFTDERELQEEIKMYQLQQERKKQEELEKQEQEKQENKKGEQEQEENPIIQLLEVIKKFPDDDLFFDEKKTVL